MKTVIKNVLLGSVAGLAMVGTAAAADLPVKAKAAEYVKICSTYGAGYYYIPGTDTCLKIGGYVTADFYVMGGTNKAHANIDFVDGPDLDVGFDDSDTQSYFKTRTAIQMDARTQTEYGTLRSYFEVRWTYGDDSALGYDDGSANQLRIKYGYIQFAGFTFGKATSAFDFWAGDFYEGIDPGFFYSDATPNQIAYTADFGNGFSATISIEDAYERHQDFFEDEFSAFGENRQEVPDIVANLTYEGSWGAAKIAGALHDLDAQFDTVNGFDGDFSPNDDWGWAVLAGIRFDIAETTTIYVEGAYADGALGYLGFGASNGVNGFAAGLATNADEDFVGFGTGSSVDVTGESISGWYVGGGIRHFWTPAVFTSLVGSYGETDKYTAFVSNFLGTDDGFTVIDGKTKVYSLAANIGWRPVKGLQFVLQYDRVYEEFDFDGVFFDDIGPIGDDAVFNGNEKAYTDRFMFEAKRSF